MEKRNTIQREIVLKAVQALHCHATADEVYAFVRNNHPTISKGTVYRNLGVLAEEGKILRISIPDGADRFDHTVKEHCHVQCKKCGRVSDVWMKKIPDLKKQISDDGGAEIESCEILFKGTCATCKKKKRRKADGSKGDV